MTPLYYIFICHIITNYSQKYMFCFKCYNDRSNCWDSGNFKASLLTGPLNSWSCSHRTLKVERNETISDLNLQTWFNLLYGVHSYASSVERVIRAMCWFCHLITLLFWLYSTGFCDHGTFSLHTWSVILDFIVALSSVFVSLNQCHWLVTWKFAIVFRQYVTGNLFKEFSFKIAVENGFMFIFAALVLWLEAAFEQDTVKVIL